MKNAILIVSCVAGFLCFSSSFPATAENFPKRVQRPVDDSIAIRQKTQKAEDRWAEKRIRLQDEYEKLEDEIERMTAANQELKKSVAARHASIAALEQKITKIERITNEVRPFLEQTYDRLARFLKEDVPFLRHERNRRIVTLRRVLDDSGVSVSEKFRKVMEAIFIEAEYGNTVEVYQERICIDGKNIQADIFRLGRISLFFQSLDRKTAGYYDPVVLSWRKLPNRYNREINAAMEMGAKRRPVDLLNLPIGKMVLK
ncbi:MAG: DUF3450 domain-containing protein [Deltaproteobacteria bacterium]|nr:DUF3450 domain-containing protein [Deltaproteobacteria bacterium]